MNSTKYFKVYKSSAGSGKTYTLVKEYLRLVLKNPAKFRQILAITFTNKAANEMKERIVNQLYKLGYGETDKDQLTKDLLEELSFDKEHLQANARQVFQNILHHYSDFAVSTIDSFTYRIVSTFAHDLKLPLRFDVELKEDEIISTAVDLLIEKVGAEKDLTEILVQFATGNLLKEKNWRIEKDLKRFSKEIFKEKVSSHLNLLKDFSMKDFQQVSLQTEKQVAAFEKDMKDIGTKACQLIQQNGLSETDFYQARSGIGVYFKNLAKGENRYKPNSYVIKTIEEDKWFSATVSGQTRAAVEQIKTSLTDFFRAAQNCIDENFALYVSQKQLLESLFSVALLNELQHIIQEYSMENTVLHISEFNKRIAEIVEKEPVPFLYERLGEQYKHYLIDEFQDTSVLQWKNLLPLVENNLAQNEFSMVVGDGKQAIYRFRQGEVEQFVQLPNVYKRGSQSFEIEREKTLQRNFEEAVLNYNFRSCAEIVNFNNRFFEKTAYFLNESYRPIYLGNENGLSNLRQIPVKEDGYVRIEFVEKENYIDDTCQKVLETIENALNEGFSYGEMAILARSNKQLKTIAAFLSEQTINNESIPLLSSESFELQNSAFVRFLHSLLKLINNPKDEVSQVESLYYLQSQGQISQQQLEEFFSAQKKDLNYLIFDFFKGLNFNIDLNIVTGFSMYDLVEELIRTFSPHKKSDIYLSAFLNYMSTWVEKPQQSLSLLLEDLEIQLPEISAKVPSGLNAIELLTIHKAKGLEYPVVIYPFADSTIKTKDNLWVELKQNELQGVPVSLLSLKKDLLDSHFREIYEEECQKSLLDILNVLYVAFTRASEQLYIFSKVLSAKSEEISYSQFLTNYLKSEGFWNEKQLVYEFGMPTKALVKKRTESITQITVKEFISTPWMEKVMIETADKDERIGAAARESVVYGILFHEALSRIFSINDIPEQISQMCAEGLLPKEQIDSFSQEVSQFINHPEIKRFFEKEQQVKTEAEIVLASGKILRPDRIILSSNETLLLDFKTGLLNAKHKKQIQTYKKTLEEMSYPSVKAFVIYFNEGKVLVEEW